MSQPRSNWAAALVAAGLSLLFIVLYGATNWLTTLRADVPSFYFEWERQIPFVPWMIVFYLSIDLFYVGAAFLTKTERELAVLFARAAAAIVIACICFLIFPLKFGFERPHAEGVLGFVFNKFRILDPPFNEFPSLHIALAMVFGATFLRHTRGLLRATIAVWLILLGISPLLVYQHHVIDIVGGFFLGVICLHFIREEGFSASAVLNERVALFYAAGAGVLIALAFAWRPWSLILLWPAFSLIVVSLGYLFMGAWIYRKYNGRLAWTTWVLLWPVLLGQWVSLAYYARGCRAFDRVSDRILIGRRLTCREIGRDEALRTAAVLDLTCEFTEARAFRGGAYRQVPILDLTAPTREQIEESLAFIREHAQTRQVYVHCKAGFSRTAAVVGALLMEEGRAATAEEAVEMLGQIRPGIVVRDEIRVSLAQFEKTRRSGSS